MLTNILQYPHVVKHKYSDYQQYKIQKTVKTYRYDVLLGGNFVFVFLMEFYCHAFPS
jgi:hypothetical protein